MEKYKGICIADENDSIERDEMAMRGGGGGWGCTAKAMLLRRQEELDLIHKRRGEPKLGTYATCAVTEEKAENMGE